MKPRLLSAFFLAALPLFTAVSSQDAAAGGISLYEIGTSDLGLAAAGYAARAEDASTLFTNPAGMSRLDRPELQMGVQFLYGDMGFEPDSGTTVTGGGGGNPIGLFPGGGLFYVHPINDRAAVGFGTFSSFGLGLSYDDDWAGRYYIQNALLAGISFMPAASVRLADWLSVGLGLNVMLGILAAEMAINNVADSLPDGAMEIKDTTVGVGFDLGVLVEPGEGTRIGVTYLSPVSLDFGDQPAFTDLGPGLEAGLGALGLLGSRLDLGVEVPQSVMLSAYHDLADRWALMANFGWQDWSKFGKVDVGITSAAGGSPTGLTTDLNYDDTFHGAVGAKFAATEEISLTSGFAYDSSAVSDADRTFGFAVGQACRLGVGVIWDLNDRFTLGGAYEFAWLGDLPVSQSRGPLAGTVSGTFDDSSLHFLSVNLRWRFGKEKTHEI